MGEVEGGVGTAAASKKLCSSCGASKSTAMFSKGQLKRTNAERRCIECVRGGEAVLASQDAKRKAEREDAAATAAATAAAKRKAEEKQLAKQKLVDEAEAAAHAEEEKLAASAAEE